MTRRSPGGHGVVELKYHPGIVELPRRHERHERVLCNQPHGVPKLGISGQCRHVVVLLSMKVSGVEPYVPRNRGPYEQRSPDPRGRR